MFYLQQQDTYESWMKDCGRSIQRWVPIMFYQLFCQRKTFIIWTIVTSIVSWYCRYKLCIWQRESSSRKCVSVWQVSGCYYRPTILHHRLKGVSFELSNFSAVNLYLALDYGDILNSHASLSKLKHLTPVREQQISYSFQRDVSCYSFLKL